MSDLDRNGDGYTEDLEDLQEDTLVPYLFNESSQTWIKLSETLDWVINMGVNTTDVDLYGEDYAGYVWADLTHFSLYGLAAMSGNNPPDVSDAHPSIEYLWPPNHKFVDVTIEGVTDPDGDPITITILDITSNEPANNQEPDWYGVGTDTVSLRAERLGSDNGRVYTITFLASDGKGGETTGTVNVFVPHNKNGQGYDDNGDQTCDDDNGTGYDVDENGQRDSTDLSDGDKNGNEHTNNGQTSDKQNGDDQNDNGQNGNEQSGNTQKGNGHAVNGQTPDALKAGNPKKSSKNKKAKSK